MKKFALLLGLVLIAFIAKAQDAGGATITVTVENVLADGGTLLASLHTEETFMKGAGIRNAAEPAKKGEVTLTFENVAPGIYAIMVMHDANDNKQMDFDGAGIPTENYGISGAANTYGPPVFSDAKFEATGENQEFRIRF